MTLVETAVVLSIFLGLVFGILDLGFAVFHRHIICEAARQGARIAAVHGYLAPDDGSTMNAWGPCPTYNGTPSQSLYSNATSYSVTADSSSDDFASAVSPYLAGIDLSTVTLTIQWLDGTNDIGNRVYVKVKCDYNNIFPLIPIMNLLIRNNSTNDNNTISLHATSTMTIAH